MVNLFTTCQNPPSLSPMVSMEKFKALALSLPGAEELPHFEKLSYRIGKKIFATLNEKDKIACLKLTVAEQDLYCLADKTAIYPVPNKWGKQGWTFFNLSVVKTEVLKDALEAAHGKLF